MKKIIMIMLAVLAINILLAQERRIEVVRKKRNKQRVYIWNAKKIIFWKDDKVTKEIKIENKENIYFEVGVSPNKQYAFVNETQTYERNEKNREMLKKYGPFHLDEPRRISTITIYDADGNIVSSFKPGRSISRILINDKGYLVADNMLDRTDIGSYAIDFYSKTGERIKRIRRRCMSKAILKSGNLLVIHLGHSSAKDDTKIYEVVLYDQDLNLLKRRNISIESGYFAGLYPGSDLDSEGNITLIYSGDNKSLNNKRVNFNIENLKEGEELCIE